MRMHNAQPGEFVALQAGNVITGNHATLSQLLPDHIVERLNNYGIETIADWKVLGVGRNSSVVREVCS